MKKLIRIILTVSLMAALALPCLAAEIPENESFDDDLSENTPLPGMDPAEIEQILQDIRDILANGENAEYFVGEPGISAAALPAGSYSPSGQYAAAANAGDVVASMADGQDYVFWMDSQYVGYGIYPVQKVSDTRIQWDTTATLVTYNNNNTGGNAQLDYSLSTTNSIGYLNLNGAIVYTSLPVLGARLPTVSSAGNVDVWLPVLVIAILVMLFLDILRIIGFGGISR